MNILAEPYQACFECKREYATAADLLDAFNQGLADMDLEPESDPERVPFCPACLHDFAFPPVPQEVTGR